MAARKKRTTQEEVQRLGPWFHNLHLPDGTQTAPKHPLGDFPRFKWDEIASLLPEDLSGWNTLDIGCNAGFYSFELAKRGARVTGIDLDPRYLAQAQWAATRYGLDKRVSFRQMQIYDLAQEAQEYDLVLFLGVFYHLRYPLLGLDIVSQKTKRMLVFQTLMAPGEEIMDPEVAKERNIHDRGILSEPGWPKMSFLEHGFAGDPTNWWAANRAAVEAMLRSSGMRILHRAGPETYVCEPDPDHLPPVRSWNRSEYLAATGQDWRGKTASEKTKPLKGTLESMTSSP